MPTEIKWLSIAKISILNKKGSRKKIHMTESRIIIQMEMDLIIWKFDPV